MTTAHTSTALLIGVLGNAAGIVSAIPAQTAEWKKRRAAFQQAANAVEKKGAQP